MFSTAICLLLWKPREKRRVRKALRTIIICMRSSRRFFSDAKKVETRENNNYFSSWCNKMKATSNHIKITIILKQSTHAPTPSSSHINWNKCNSCLSICKQEHYCSQEALFKEQRLLLCNMLPQSRYSISLLLHHNDMCYMNTFIVFIQSLRSCEIRQTESKGNKRKCMQCNCKIN